MRRIIINGANGYVASNLIAALLRNRHEVVAFVRGTSDLTADQRMKDALGLVSKDIPFRKLNVFDYSLLEEDYAIPEKKLKDIFQPDADFLHFAACLKFKSRDRDEIFKTNVGGVENTVKLFHKYATSGSRFFFVGTVYSCGKTSEVFEERFYENAPISEFRNYYEQSKRFAENTVRKSIEEDQLKGHVIRLSQVVGNSRSGVTKTNYGIFDFIKKIQVFTTSYPHERIRVQIDPDSTQNLIPINAVVTYFLKTLEKNELPVIQNFAAREPVKNKQIVSAVCSLLPVEIIQEKKLDRKALNKYERMILAGMSFTGEYASTNMKFDTTNLEKTVSPNGSEITKASLQKMIKYFIES